MSTEENQVVDVEARALSRGWIPKDDFKGDPARWVDAETYVQRSEEFIPFIKAENRTLKSEVNTLKTDLSSMKALLTETNTRLTALQKENSEINKLRVEQVRKQLIEELGAARQEGDIVKEEKIRDQLDDVKEAQKASAAEPTVKPVVKSQVDPDVKAEWDKWVSENSWWNENRAMRALSVDIANELAAKGEITESMPPAERFKKVSDATQAEWNRINPPQRRASKVEGGKGGEPTGGDRGGRRTFSDLPAEAKEGCERSLNYIQIGEGHKFKTIADYRQHYANKFYGEA